VLPCNPRHGGVFLVEGATITTAGIVVAQHAHDVVAVAVVDTLVLRSVHVRDVLTVSTVRVPVGKDENTPRERRLGEWIVSKVTLRFEERVTDCERP
jgi:hypothetical protein